MMRRILLMTFALGMQMIVIGQNKQPLKPPPIRKPAAAPSANTQKTVSVYEKILKDQHSPLAFRWTVQQDTLLLPNQIFKKHIEINLYEAALNYAITKDSVTLKKEESYQPFSHKVKYMFFSVSLNKDILTLTDKKTEQVIKFKLFLSPEKNEIIKIQDLNSKEIYQPTAFEGPVISM